MNVNLPFRPARWFRGLFAVLFSLPGLATGAGAGTNSPPSRNPATNGPATNVAPPAVSSASATNRPMAGLATNAPVQLDYASFRLITERNIFNQNRTPRRAGRGQNQARQARFDSFTLVGTMSSGKGEMAFFDGSSSDYRKSLKAAGSIAGYKVAAITNGVVTLELAGKKLVMHVGSHMRREEGGEWELSGEARASRGGNTSSNTVAAASGAADSGADSSSDNDSSGAGSDVLQRLLKKREQELNDEKP